ncbi:hypothetical protein E2C01_048658 [Portunus trituberculatus]|uniref:Uncharacterized protein n=1 Tax=Portunus trituberculatus TaxID=210409 RepID=A0A5B7GBQ1_PORTR|nr:hypothetical protein [Portunus trituberculatus]
MNVAAATVSTIASRSGSPCSSVCGVVTRKYTEADLSKEKEEAASLCAASRLFLLIRLTSTPSHAPLKACGLRGMRSSYWSGKEELRRWRQALFITT